MSPRTFLVACACTIALAVPACAYDPPRPAAVEQVSTARVSSAHPTADRRPPLAQLTAAQHRAFRRWLRAVALHRWLLALERNAMRAHPWPCMAVAETSNRPAMGPTYWTEWGVVVDVIEDFATPAEQHAIFSGRAGARVRWRPVARFAAVHGFGGWGSLTKQKCRL